MADWNKLRSRGKVSDRRELGATGASGLGIVGILIVVGISLLGGEEINLGNILTQINSSQAQTQQVDPAEFEGLDSYEVFASTVLGSNNDMWRQVFLESGQTYQEPELVLFRGSTSSRCGGASSAVGPHYCPGDNKIYLDETFFDLLKQQFGARGGDVAEAYVISHEVGHHVQNELGILFKAQRSNEDSIKAELQADCFAGLWAHSIKDSNVFEQGELLEAIDAAEAVGDDRIQEKTSGRINPENWTHGSSNQRKQWFNRGLQTGSVAACNTFV